MFTINIYLKLALIVLGLIGGPILSYTMGFWYGFPFIIIGLVMLASYLLMGTVQTAAMKMQAQDFAGAEKQLDLTLFPSLLFGPMKSGYYTIKSTIAMNSKDLNQAEAYLDQASKVGMASDDEKAMVMLQKAGIAIQKGKWPIAKKLLSDIKKLSVKEPMLKEQIKEFSKVIKNSGSIKQSHQMMRRGFRQGGAPKRR